MSSSNSGLRDEIGIEVPVTSRRGDLVVPEDAVGIVLFAHGSGSSRHSRRNRYVAEGLQEAGLATLLTDLRTAEEDAYPGLASQCPLIAPQAMAILGFAACRGMNGYASSQEGSCAFPADE